MIGGLINTILDFVLKRQWSRWRETPRWTSKW